MVRQRVKPKTHSFGEYLPGLSDQKGWQELLDAVKPSGTQEEKQGGTANIPGANLISGTKQSQAIHRQGVSFTGKAEGSSQSLPSAEPVWELRVAWSGSFPPSQARELRYSPSCYVESLQVPSDHKGWGQLEKQL